MSSSVALPSALSSPTSAAELDVAAVPDLELPEAMATDAVPADALPIVITRKAASVGHDRDWTVALAPEATRADAGKQRAFLLRDGFDGNELFIYMTDGGFLLQREPGERLTPACLSAGSGLSRPPGAKRPDLAELEACLRQRIRGDIKRVPLLFPAQNTSIADIARVLALLHGFQVRGELWPARLGNTQAGSLNSLIAAAERGRAPEATNAVRTIAAMKPEFQACYRQLLARVPAANGTVRLKIELSSDGRAGKVTSEVTGDLEGIVVCLEAHAARARFDPPRDDSDTVVVALVFPPKPSVSLAKLQLAPCSKEPARN